MKSTKPSIFDIRVINWSHTVYEWMCLCSVLPYLRTIQKD